MMREERRTWVEESEKLRRRQLDECPEELRPWLHKFHGANKAMMLVLSQPNRLRYAIRLVEERLLAASNLEEAAPLSNVLERLEGELADAERVLGEAKEANVTASTEYQNAHLEWRVREVPEGRRDEARTLLREERDRIASLYEATPGTGDVYRAAAAEIVRRSALLSKARRTGDHEGAARLEAEFDAARARFGELQSLLETRKQAQQDLEEEYEQRLRALIDEGSM